MNQPAHNTLFGKINVLDGFRGLAVLLLCCYHFLDFFSFAFCSVDLFFVLSGFLITGKLLASAGKADYFGVFYVNRILRIVPLSFAVLLIFFVLVPLLFPSAVSASFNALLQQQVYYWTFTVNINDAVHGWPSNITLIHFWSLACEMQFYLLWPLLIYFLHNRKKQLAIAIAVIFLLGILFRIYAYWWLPLKPAYRHVLLPCRLDAFCAGALLYLAYQSGFAARYKKVYPFVLAVLPCTVLVLLAVTGTAWHFGVDYVARYGYTLNVIFWTALMGFTLTAEKGFCVSVLCSRAMTVIGKYSYGIYVFHLPVYILLSKKLIFNAGPDDRTIMLAAISFIAAYVCSFASFHLLEKHFLKLKTAV